MKSQLFLSIGAVALAGSFLVDPRPAQTAEGGAAERSSTASAGTIPAQLASATAASVPAATLDRQAALDGASAKH